MTEHIAWIVVAVLGLVVLAVGLCLAFVRAYLLIFRDS